ncbi:hypothetical protein niasHT_021807 [Heterodera trifolii]|uniref:RING-type E3 ubiquitin transferase n=1 Tax=Heterodera trifolii TaxID=157864 RepID=A0ABD2J8K7_9BILA
MNSSEETTENVGLGGNKDERQTTSKDETDESNSENQRNEQRQRQMDSEKEDSRFECNICLDMAKDAVVSMCGHLFCWPCLFQWMDTRPYRQLCPVCKSAISKDKVIPLYGRGGGDSDPREKIPPRPQGQRTEETNQGFPGMFHWGGDNGGHGGGGVQFSLGIGVFPISFFASFFNTNFGGADRRPDPPPVGSRQMVEEQLLSNTFLYIGVLILLWLVFV